MNTDTRIEDPEDRDGSETPGASDRRRRLRRNAVLGLAVALGVAGISVLSVFVYSLFDDDGPGDGWFAYEGAFRPVDYPEDGGYQGDERGKGPHGGVHDRAGDKDTARDRAAGRVDASNRTGDSGGDGGTGPGDDTAATDGLADCVELKSLGDRALLLCDRGEQDGWDLDLPKEGRGKWLGPDVPGGGWPRGWSAWSSGPGHGPRGSGRWSSGGGPFGHRPFGGGFPYEHFPERAPMGCPGFAPWGTMPDGGAGFGSEWSTPPDGYCVQGERDGYAFEECYGFSGGFPPEGDVDQEALDELIPPELFEEWFGRLFGSILEGLQQEDFDAERLDGSIPPELTEEMFEDMLGSILGNLFDDLDPDGLSFGPDLDALDFDDFDLEGFEDLIPGELTEESFGDLLGALLEAVGLADLTSEAPDAPSGDEPGAG